MDKARRPGVTVRTRVAEYVDGRWQYREDRLATEEPLEIRLGWPESPARRIGVTMRTPGHDFELAAGLLHAEGLLVGDHIHRVAYCTDADLTDEQEFNVVTVELTAPPPRQPADGSSRTLVSTSACGVCGAQSIEEVLGLAEVAAPRDTCDVAAHSVTVSSAVLVSLPERLRTAQRVFERTGGLHAAGLFEADGQLLLAREDIGRHNAVDKVVGARLLANHSPAVPILCVSGRLGFEVAQKAAVAGIAVVAGIGAPSSLAVSLAQETGLTLIGFLSSTRFVIYAGRERITD